MKAENIIIPLIIGGLIFGGFKLISLLENRRSLEIKAAQAQHDAQVKARKDSILFNVTLNGKNYQSVEKSNIISVNGNSYFEVGNEKE